MAARPRGQWSERPRLGVPMRFDHRRILATAIGRVRAKIKYRPVIFELMPDDFTLFELQRTVEAILGPHLHKQNFRRLVEGAGLVETTGEVKMRTGGRPAKLYRFRREVLLERPAPGCAGETRQGVAAHAPRMHGCMARCMNRLRNKSASPDLLLSGHRELDAVIFIRPLECSK